MGIFCESPRPFWMRPVGNQGTPTPPGPGLAQFARRAVQAQESLAVALQGKRPPPTPSPASKATLAQEGPSKAAAIEDDSSETNKSESGGDDGQ